jgi:acyl carrier protein
MWLDSAQIKPTLRRFVLDYFIKEQDIPLEDDTSFLDARIIDSTGVMELVAFLEETFDIRLEDEEITPDNFDSIDRLYACVRSKLESKSSA